MRVHGRYFPSSPKKNGKQQRKKLPAGRKRACRLGGLLLSLSFPARIQRELRRQSDRPPQQYKLRDASARSASCGSTGTAPSLFLMAGRHPGAWPGSGRAEGCTNKKRPARTARRRPPGPCEVLTGIPARFCVAPYGGSPLLMCRKHRSGPTYNGNCFRRMWVRFFMKRDSSIRDARESVRHKNSNCLRAKEKYLSGTAPSAYDHYKQGRREAATRIFHGYALKVREGCGSAPAYFTVSIAFDTARSAQKHFAMCLLLHRLKTNGQALVQLPAHWNGTRPRRGKI